MKTYAITVREILERTVCVEAEDLQEATDKVEDAYNRSDIVLTVEDFCGKEFIPSVYIDGDDEGEIPEYDMGFYKKNYQWI